MGMSINATICIGAVVLSEESEINTKFIEENSEMLDDEYEGSFSEYLYDKFENDKTEIDFAGTSEYSETIVYLKGTQFSVDWLARPLEIKDLGNIEEKITELKKVLKEYGLEYETCGLLLYPYYSY